MFGDTMSNLQLFQDRSGAGAKMVSNLQEGDMVVHNGRLYRYEGKTGETNGTFISIETGKRISYSEISTSLQQSSIISDPGVLNERSKETTGLPENAIIRGQAKFALLDGKHAASMKWMKHVLTIDIEADHLDSATVIDHASIRQIGYSEMDLQEMAYRTGARKFNRKGIGSLSPEANPGIRNVAIVNDTITRAGTGNGLESILMKIRKQNEQTYNELFKGQHFKVANQTIIKGTATTLGQLNKTVENMFGSESAEAVQVAKMIDIMGEHGSVVSSFASGAVDTKGVSEFNKTVMRNLAKAGQQASVLASSHTNFDMHLLQSVAQDSAHISFADTRMQTAITLERLFPEASTDHIEMLSKFGKGLVSKAKALKSAGMNADLYPDVELVQKAFINVIKGVGRGFTSDTAGMTSVDTAFNTLWAEVYNGGNYIREMHEASPDARMQNALLGDVFSRRESFLRDFAKIQHERGLSVREGYLYSATRYEMFKLLQEQMGPYGGKDTAAIINKRIAAMDKLFSRESDSGAQTRFNNMYERITNEEIARSTSISRKVFDYFGTNTIKATMGGAFLAAGVQSTVNKLDDQFNKVRSIHDKEGMSHSSFDTVIRRLAMTQFGSGFLGKTKSFLEGAIKTVFMSSSRQGTKTAEMLGAFNKAAHEVKDASPIKAFSEIRKAIYHFGESIENGELKYANNPVGHSLANLAKKIGINHKKPSFGETLGKFNWDIREFTRAYATQKMGVVSEAEALKINRAYSIFSHRNLNANDPVDVFRYRARKYVYAGAGAAIGVNFLAGSYTAKEHPEERDVKPNDLYTKQAFKTDQFRLTNDMHKASLSDAMNMKDKGLQDTSRLREIQRNSMTDFGSKREAFNPTTTSNAKDLINDPNPFASANRLLPGFYGRRDNEASISKANVAINEITDSENHIFEVSEEARLDGIKNLSKAMENMHDIRQNIASVNDNKLNDILMPRYFDDGERIKLSMPAETQNVVAARRIDPVADVTVNKQDRSFIDSPEFKYMGFVGHAEPYTAPQLPNLTNQYRNEYAEQRTPLILNEQHDADFRTIGYERNPTRYGLNDQSLLAYLESKSKQPESDVIRDNSNALGGFINPNLDNIQNIGDVITSSFDKERVNIDHYDQLPQNTNLTQVISSANFNQNPHSVMSSIDLNSDRSGKIISMIPESSPQSSLGIQPLSMELVNKLTIDSEAINHTQERTSFADDVVNYGMQA